MMISLFLALALQFAWTVRPVAPGESVEAPASPGVVVQRDVLGRWADGTPRLVRETRGLSASRKFSAHPALLELLPEGVHLDVDGHRINLLQHAVGVDAWGPHRLTTAHRARPSAQGGLTWWLVAWRDRPHLEVHALWHNGFPEARDVLFRGVRVLAPSGFKWDPLVPEPAAGVFPPEGPDGRRFLVRPLEEGLNVLPVGCERPLRFAVYPKGTPRPRLWSGWEGSGWDRSGAGYLARNAPVAPHARLEPLLRRRHARETNRLLALLPSGGTNDARYAPPAAFVPAKGVHYGGMSGGYERYDLWGAEVAATGWPGGLELHAIGFLRARVRQTGAISYGVKGRPDGGERVRGGWEPPYDRAPYLEAWEDFERYDRQHKDRSGDYYPLAWLAGDPLARWALLHDAAKAAGNAPPWGDLAGQGSALGREGSNEVDILCNAYVFASDADRVWILEALRKWRSHWESAVAPGGSTLKVTQYKIVEDEPLGHRVYDLCSLGIHPLLERQGEHDYRSFTDAYGHRANELGQVIRACYAIDQTTGLSCRKIIVPALKCMKLWWPRGGNGMFNRYPVQLVTSEYVTAVGQVPETMWVRMVDVGTSNYQLGNVFYYASRYGVSMTDEILGYAGVESLEEVHAALSRRDPEQFPQYAATLTLE